MQATSVRKRGLDDIWGFVTQDPEKSPLSILTCVCSNQVNFREEKSFSSRQTQSLVYMTVGIKRVSVQRGFTVLHNAMIKLKRYFMKLMLACQFTFYSHWRSSCSNCCQSIFNLDKLSWGTRDYWEQYKLVKIRTHVTLPLTMTVTMKIMQGAKKMIFTACHLG